MSYLHFTSTEQYRNRVIQLGESPDRVFNIGAIGVENALNMDLLSRNELCGDLSIKADSPYAVMTYHPATLDNGDPLEKLDVVLSAISAFPNITFVCTMANADSSGRSINSRLAEFEKDHANFRLYDSLGSLRYLSAISFAEFVIGNSSSGILEAPAFGTPTINLGNRQKGRVRPPSVFDCEEDLDSIIGAIETVLRFDGKEGANLADNPYYKKNTAEKAAQIMVDALSGHIDLQKRFYDIGL